MLSPFTEGGLGFQNVRGGIELADHRYGRLFIDVADVYVDERSGDGNSTALSQSHYPRHEGTLGFYVVWFVWDVFFASGALFVLSLTISRRGDTRASAAFITFCARSMMRSSMEAAVVSRRGG